LHASTTPQPSVSDYWQTANNFLIGAGIRSPAVELQVQ